MSFKDEFKQFAIKGNVMDLAVGVIIGAAFGKIVDSLVNDIIMPVAGRLLGGFDFSNYFILLGAPPPGIALTYVELKKAGVPLLAYGNFLTVTVNFVILAFLIFMLVKQINKLKRDAPAQPTAPSAELMVLKDIRDELVRRRAV